MENVRLAILFCDVHGFARIAVQLGSRSAPFVQEFYEAMGDEITARGGTIVKYIGDSVLATFPDGAERQAVAAALAMRRAMAALVARWGIEGDCDLEVAVSAGPVTRGLFGHRSLRTMDVLGGTVNEAAVLTRYRGVVVTGPVNEALAGEFRTEPLADFPLKWRGEPLRAWRLVEGG